MELDLEIHQFVTVVSVMVVVGDVIHAFVRNVQNAKERKLICCVTKVYAQSVVMAVSHVLVKVALSVGLGVWTYYAIKASVKIAVGGVMYV